MKKLFFAILIIVLCVVACSKQSLVDERQNIEKSSIEFAFPDGIKAVVGQEKLSYKQAKALGFEISRSDFKKVKVSLCSERSEDDGIFRDPILLPIPKICNFKPTSSFCCDAHVIKCDSFDSPYYRMVGCFEPPKELDGVRIQSRWFVDGESILSISMNVELDELSDDCNYYDPAGFYENGELVGWACFVPLIECPAYADVRTFFQFKIGDTWFKCGRNHYEYFVPGDPDVCDWH